MNIITTTNTSGLGPAFASIDYGETVITSVDPSYSSALHHISERLDKIEERIGILQRNLPLEDRWPELRELGQAYHDMEDLLMEKEKTWRILKN